MIDSAPVGGSPMEHVAKAYQATRRDTRLSSTVQQSAATPRGSDQVEVSALATYLAKIKALPAIRHELVESVKAQIAAGTYDTPERFSAAADAMIDELAQA